MNERTFTLKDIKELCEEYDKDNGDYPEHEFEGAAVYDWIEWHLGCRVKKDGGRYG